MAAAQRKKRTFEKWFIKQFVQMTGEFSVGGGGKGSIYIEGFMMDQDDDYYFLSTETEEIDLAVRKSQVTSIHTIKQKDKYDTMLDELEIPNEDQHN